MVRVLPSPLVLLYVISMYEDGITVNELYETMETIQKRGIELGYKFVNMPSNRKLSKELMLDLNLLKVLNLVKEIDGRIYLTEKGRQVVEKMLKVGSIPTTALNNINKIVRELKELKIRYVSTQQS